MKRVKRILVYRSSTEKWITPWLRHNSKLVSENSKAKAMYNAYTERVEAQKLVFTNFSGGDFLESN
jgi:hypothetical protein